MCNEIRIYVADLAAYNNGKYHGVWIDATQDVENMYAEVRAMLKSSPEGFAEEWEIHDYEGFGEYRLSEYIGIDHAHEIAVFIKEHGEVALAALQHWQYLCDAKEAVENNYHGGFDSEEEFAEQFYNDCYEIPKYLEYYIDYKAIARDMFCDGFIAITDENYQIHVFSQS